MQCTVKSGCESASRSDELGRVDIGAMRSLEVGQDRFHWSYPTGAVHGCQFGSESNQIDTKWDKSGIFEDQFSVHFGSVSQNVLKINL